MILVLDERSAGSPFQLSPRLGGEVKVEDQPGEGRRAVIVAGRAAAGDKPQELEPRQVGRIGELREQDRPPLLVPATSIFCQCASPL